jgi:hypothetical protein
MLKYGLEPKIVLLIPRIFALINSVSGISVATIVYYGEQNNL